MKKISIVVLMVTLVAATNAYAVKGWMEFTDANATGLWGDPNNWADTGTDLNTSPYAKTGTERLPRAYDANYNTDAVMIRNAVNVTIANGVQGGYGGSCVIGGSEYRDPNSSIGDVLWAGKSSLLVQAGGSLYTNWDSTSNITPLLIVGDWYDGELTSYGYVNTNGLYIGNRGTSNYNTAQGTPDPTHQGWTPKGIFIMKGGTLSGLQPNASGSNPKLIVGAFNGGNGSFRMEDGLITYNGTTSTNARTFAISVGGENINAAVSLVSKGTFEMVGGVIDTPAAAVGAGLNGGQGLITQSGGSMHIDKLTIAYNRTDNASYYDPNFRAIGKYIMTGGTLNMSGGGLIGQNVADGTVDANNALIQIRSGGDTCVGQGIYKTTLGIAPKAYGTFTLTNSRINSWNGSNLLIGYGQNNERPNPTLTNPLDPNTLVAPVNASCPTFGLFVMNSGSINLGLTGGSLLDPTRGSANITLGSYRKEQGQNVIVPPDPNYLPEGGTFYMAGAYADPNSATGIMYVKGGSITTAGDVRIGKSTHSLGSLYVSKSAYFKANGTLNMYPEVANKKSVLDVEVGSSTMLNIGTGKLADTLNVRADARPSKEGTLFTIMTAALYVPDSNIRYIDSNYSDPNDPNYYYWVDTPTHREGGFLKDPNNGNAFYNFSTFTSNSFIVDANHGFTTSSAFGGAIVDGNANDPNSHDYYNVVFLGLTGGDAQGDHKVSGGDLGILGANWGATSGKTWVTGDFNGDGKVSGGDLGILGANWGWIKPGPAPAPGGDIPEPATLALLGLGALSLIRRRRT